MTDAQLLRIKALELALAAATSYPPPHIVERQPAAAPEAKSIVTDAEVFFAFLSP
jgi:hypothetical protein